MRFEWDERKRLSNLAKHGLDLLTLSWSFEVPAIAIVRFGSTRSGG
jgi:uncharacterized DUF497 family protein